MALQEKSRHLNPLRRSCIYYVQAYSDLKTEVHTMNYWHDISLKVRKILDERPELASYDNHKLFSRWVRNLSPTAQGVICSVRELRGSEACAL